MGRNYSRKENPTLSDLPLIWDNANSDWRLTTIAAILDLFLDAVNTGIVDAEQITGSLDNLTNTNLYGIGTLTTGQPASVSTPALVAHKSFDSANAIQIVYDITNNTIWQRSKASGIWGTWSQFISTTDATPSDSAITISTTLLNGWTGTIQYIKRAGIVTVSVDADGSSKTGNTLFTMPVGYRPALTLFGAEQAANLQFDIITAGDIISGSATTIKGFFTYPVLP